jgi:hypothetical protein
MRFMPIRYTPIVHGHKIYDAGKVMSHRRGARELRGSPTCRLTLDLPALRVGDGKNGVGVSE